MTSNEYVEELKMIEDRTKREAIKFVEWLRRNAIMDADRWYYIEGDYIDRIYLTTEELYKKYLHRNEEQNIDNLTSL